MKRALGEDENFFINGEKLCLPHNPAQGERREQARRRDWLFGAGAAWEDFGGHVGQIVSVGNKTLPASKEGQHTVCSLMVDEKPVVSARWSGNGKGAWSEIVGREGGDGFVRKGIRNLRLFTLLSQNARQLVSKRRAAGFLREVRYLGHRGTARYCQGHRQGERAYSVGWVHQPCHMKQPSHGAEVYPPPVRSHNLILLIAQGAQS